MNTRLMKVYEDLTFQSAKDNDLKRENANIDGDTAMGTMLKYGSVGAKEFNEMYVLAPEHSKAHQEGDIHIHDLDFYTLTTTCTQIDLTKLFDKGFSTGHGFCVHQMIYKAMRRLLVLRYNPIRTTSMVVNLFRSSIMIWLKA